MATTYQSCVNAQAVVPTPLCSLETQIDMEAEESKMIDAIDSHAELNVLVTYFRKNGIKSRMFGSATWLLGANQLGDHDVDIIIEKSEKLNSDNINETIRAILPDVVISAVKFVEDEYSHDVENEFSSHYELSTKNTKFDLLITSSIVDKFVNHMADIDNGMLIFDLITNKFDVGCYVYSDVYGKNVSIKPLTPQYVMSINRNKIITMKHLIRVTDQTTYVRTHFTRLMRYIKNGFILHNTDEKVLRVILMLFMHSFCIESRIDNPKYKNMFVENCLSDDQTYQLVTQYFEDYKKIISEKNRNLRNCRLFDCVSIV
jgi:hypothetical protein